MSLPVVILGILPSILCQSFCHFPALFSLFSILYSLFSILDSRSSIRRFNQNPYAIRWTQVHTSCIKNVSIEFGNINSILHKENVSNFWRTIYEPLKNESCDNLSSQLKFGGMNGQQFGCGRKLILMAA